MRIISLSAILVYFISNTIFAQKLNYSILRDNAKDFDPKLQLSIQAFQFDMKMQGNDGFPLRSGLKLNKKIFSNFIINADATIAWKNVWLRKNQETKWLYLPLEMNAGGEWRFSNTSRKKSVKIKLSQKQYKTYNTTITETNSMWCRATEVTRWSLMGGINYYSQSTNLIMHKHVKNFSKSDIKAKAIDSAIGMWSNNTMLYAGVQLQQVIDAIFNIEQYGTRKVQYLENIRVEALFAFSQNFKYQDMMPQTINSLRGKKISQEKMDEAFGKKSPLGWRLIMEQQLIGYGKDKNKAGGTVKFELGNKPYTGWYSSIGFGINIIQKN